MAGRPPATDPAVSVLVISYNTRAMTLACLRSLAAETRTPHEVIVLDNASTDGSADAIAAAFPDLTLIRSEANLGFAGGNNRAAEAARGRYILLLNPDTVVLDGAVDKLVAFAREVPQARIWGGRTLYGDMSLNPGSCWQRITLWNLFCRATGLTSISYSRLLNGEAYGGWQRNEVRAVDIVTGCFLLIERDFWHRLGGFDPLFYMYGEEADLCLRARELGANPHITPEACIIHYGGASEKVPADKMVRLLTGKTALIDRHMPRWQRSFAKFLFLLWPLSRYIGTNIMGYITGDRSTREASEIWGEIWKRRSLWKRGYRPADQ